MSLRAWILRGKKLVSVLFVFYHVYSAHSPDLSGIQSGEPSGNLQYKRRVDFDLRLQRYCHQFFCDKNYYDNIPRDLEEAARIDGCGYAQTWWKVIFPIARPGIMTAAVLAFLTNWNEYYWASLVVIDREKLTVPALLSTFTTAFQTNYNGLFSAMVIIILPPVILYCVFNKFFVEALSGRGSKRIRRLCNTMKTVTAILLGAGQRGVDACAAYAKKYPNELKIVGVAEPRQERRKAFARAHEICEENSVSSWEELLNRPKMADCVFICTQDKMHYEPLKQAARLGYHILCEKPVSPDKDELLAFRSLAEQYDRVISVAHVLRYSPFLQR